MNLDDYRVPLGPLEHIEADPFPFDCPRCGALAHEKTYGPCSACRGELRATQRNPPRDVPPRGRWLE